jgi:hypothetical protein
MDALADANAVDEPPERGARLRFWLVWAVVMDWLTLRCDGDEIKDTECEEVDFETAERGYVIGAYGGVVVRV